MQFEGNDPEMKPIDFTINVGEEQLRRAAAMADKYGIPGERQAEFWADIVDLIGSIDYDFGLNGVTRNIMAGEHAVFLPPGAFQDE